MPHNDPLLIDIGIGECQVTKVLVDTGSSVDLIFRDTLDKMGIDLRDMKTSSRTLTSFNRASEQMIGTIRLPVYACDVVRTIKFSVIRTKAPYSAILGTPIPSTYHQCVKFPGKDGTTKTIRGHQRAARELLIATVKLQRSTSLVNSVAKPFHKIYPRKRKSARFLSKNLIHQKSRASERFSPTKCIRRLSLSSRKTLRLLHGRTRT